MTPKLRPELWLCLLICLLSITLCSRAQTPAAQPENVLRNELMGHRFILRNMSAATQVHGSWDGHTVTLDSSDWHTFAALIVHTVKLMGSEVKIEATRNEIVRDKTGKLSLSSVATPVTLTLTLEGDPATLAPTLRDAVFFPSVDAALAAVPKGFQKAIPPQAGGIRAPVTPQPACDCADTSGTCHAVNDYGMKRAKVLSSAEPQFSDEARRRKINGTLEVGLLLDDTGAIIDKWLIYGLGYGLDEQAAISVNQYKFAPATCHGTPMGATLFIEVAFHTN